MGRSKEYRERDWEHWEPIRRNPDWVVEFQLPEEIAYRTEEKEATPPGEVSIRKKLMKEVKKKFKK